MEPTTILVIALTVISICFLVYVEVKSRRNSASAEQTPLPEIAPSEPAKRKRSK